MRKRYAVMLASFVASLASLGASFRTPRTWQGVYYLESVSRFPVSRAHAGMPFVAGLLSLRKDGSAEMTLYPADTSKRETVITGKWMPGNAYAVVQWNGKDKSESRLFA